MLVTRRRLPKPALCHLPAAKASHPWAAAKAAASVARTTVHAVFWPAGTQQRAATLWVSGTLPAHAVPARVVTNRAGALCLRWVAGPLGRLGAAHGSGPRHKLPLRLSLTKPHTLHLVHFAQAVLEVTSAQPPDADALELWRYRLVQSRKRCAPRIIITPRCIHWPTENAIQSALTPRARSGERPPVVRVAQRLNVLHIRDHLRGHERSKPA